MPIKPENKRRYPQNWREIRAAILERAQRRCERCGVPDRVYRIRGTNDWTYNAGQAETWAMDGERVSMIVLTIAHLDHQPEHNEPSNLAALCQRCHLAYDAAHHRRSAYRTRRTGKAINDLFDGAAS